LPQKKYNEHAGPIFKENKILPYDKILLEAKYKFMLSSLLNDLDAYKLYTNFTTFKMARREGPHRKSLFILTYIIKIYIF
jgi:hypothetical protein